MIKTYPHPSEINTAWAFEHYQTIRHTLPKASFPQTSQWVEGLTDLVDDFDVFLLDAFGVLNVGQTAVKSAHSAVESLQSAGKKVMVLTNGASLTATDAQIKFQPLSSSGSPSSSTSLSSLSGFVKPADRGLFCYRMLQTLNS